MLFLDRSIYLSFCIDSRRPPVIEGRREENMKDARLNIRISSELIEQAKKLAEADGRDLTNWVTWLIRKEIEKAAEK